MLVSFDGAPPSQWRPNVGAESDGDGYLGGSLWTGVGEAETALGVTHFADAESAALHLRQRAEDPDIVERIADVPPTVRHLRVEGHHGARLESSEVGGYLTTLHLVASPGYGAEAGAQMEDGLASIATLEGYAGYVRGVNAALEDETWALVLWSAPPVLAAPTDLEGVVVEHFRRVR